MKKIYVIFISFILSLLTIYFCDLKIKADGFNYPTAGVSIELSNSYNVDTSYTWNGIEFESIYPIVFYKDSSGTGIFPVSPLAYGHSRSYRKTINSYNTPSTPELDYGDWESISWRSYEIDNNTYYYSDNGFNISPWNNQISNFKYSSSNVIVFNSLINACRYLSDPSNADNLDNVYDDIGSDILQESVTPNVNWGNGIPYMDGSIPSQSIPAPKFNVSGGQSGNITKNITFLNFEYDSRAQDGKYGLVLYMKWASLNDFYLAHTGGPFADTYKVTYGQTLPWGDYVFVYDVPEKENQVNYCPQSFSFTTNQACINGFQSYLTNYPISSRTIKGPTEMNSITGVGPIESFSDYLNKPACPYNTLMFYCYYYRKMPDGHFEYGPSSTGTFYPPSQNAIFNMNSKTSNDQGSMNTGYGGGASGESDDPFNSGNNWNQQWGDNTPNIDYGQHADPQALVNNISDLFGLIGQMPSFMGQLFVFLPTWLINFISVSIALAIAIGVVKLFIG